MKATKNEKIKLKAINIMKFKIELNIQKEGGKTQNGFLGKGENYDLSLFFPELFILVFIKEIF